MKRIETILDHVVLVLLTTALSIMVIATFAQVIFRFLLGSPLFWSEELGRYCFVYIVFIGGAWAGKQLAHLGVDFFANKLPRGANAVVDIVIDLLIMSFSLVVICVSFPVIGANMKQLSPALQIPMGLVYLAIPIGFILMFGYYFIHFTSHIHALKSKSYIIEESEG